MKTTEFVCKNCREVFQTPAAASLCFEIEKPTAYKQIPVCPLCHSTAFEQKEPPVTKEELSQYRHLKRELEQEKQKLARKSEQDPEYAEYYELVENNKMRCMALLIKLQSFIYSIDDSFLRQIFELRYVQGKSWQGISAELGGYNSPDYLRILHDRYLQKLK